MIFAVCFFSAWKWGLKWILHLKSSIKGFHEDLESLIWEHSVSRLFSHFINNIIVLFQSTKDRFINHSVDTFSAVFTFNLNLMLDLNFCLLVVIKHSAAVNQEERSFISTNMFVVSDLHSNAPDYKFTLWSKNWSSKSLCSVSGKIFASFLISHILHICHISLFQLIKLNSTEDKDHLSEHKIHFMNNHFIY